MHETTEHTDALRKLRELIRDIEIGMLTTVDHDGLLRSRPMAVQQTEMDADLWFFTREDTAKVDEIIDEHRVGVTFADPKHQRYVSISGVATALRDRARIRELWKPSLKMWFPRGVDDPEIMLLRVHAEAAEYWDASSSKMVHLFSALKAALTGSDSDKDERGDHAKLRGT